MQSDIQDFDEPKYSSTGDTINITSVEELLAALEGFKDLSDDDKEQLKQSLAERNQYSQHLRMSSSPITNDFVILLCFVSTLMFVFAFFGYKLYKSLAEKQRRQEEKKKIKQQKKKK